MIKIKKSELCKNVIKGFIIAIIPMIIIDMHVIFSLGFFKDFISNILADISIYGLIGVIVAIAYTYLSNKYPRFSKYAIFVVIIGYYVIYLGSLIVAIYLRDKII